MSKSMKVLLLCTFIMAIAIGLPEIRDYYARKGLRRQNQLHIMALWGAYRSFTLDRGGTPSNATDLIRFYSNAEWMKDQFQFLPMGSRLPDFTSETQVLIRMRTTDPGDRMPLTIFGDGHIEQ